MKAFARLLVCTSARVRHWTFEFDLILLVLNRTNLFWTERVPDNTLALQKLSAQPYDLSPQNNWMRGLKPHIFQNPPHPPPHPRTENLQMEQNWCILSLTRSQCARTDKMPGYSSFTTSKQSQVVTRTVGRMGKRFSLYSIDRDFEAVSSAYHYKSNSKQSMNTSSFSLTFRDTLRSV